MNLLGLAIYILLWWLSFFVMLPLGVRNLDEAGVEITPGVERGAPAQHGLAKKAMLAALLAAIVWGIGYALLASGVVSFYGAAGAA